MITNVLINLTFCKVFYIFFAYILNLINLI